MTDGVKNLPEGVRVLTESEIQDRLYGEYLGRRKKWEPVEPFQEELNRLRTELVTLRQERDQLAAELHRDFSPRTETVFKRRTASLGLLFGIGILLVGLGYPIGTQILQASPSLSESSAYTLQVAVYDVRRYAEEALQRLRELGAAAFLAEFPRRNGQPRYRLYVGQFVTKLEAEAERLRLAADPRFRDAFVRIR